MHEKWITVRKSTSKLYDDLRMCPYTSQFTPQFGYQHFVELPQSIFPDYTNSLTFPWLWAFSLILDLSLTLAKFPTFPGFKKFQKSYNPVLKQFVTIHKRLFCHTKGDNSCMKKINNSAIQTSPTSISKMRTPRPHQSTARVYDDSVSTSGARNSGVPQNVEVRSPKPIPSLHRPKSAIFTNPSASSSRLSSFRSLKNDDVYELTQEK